MSGPVHKRELGPISTTDARESDPEDPGNQQTQAEKKRSSEKVSAFKSLGWLDRFLAVWILLAMIVGVLLGNFVTETGPALQKGKFAGVSVPIGMYVLNLPALLCPVLQRQVRRERRVPLTSPPGAL